MKRFLRQIHNIEEKFDHKAEWLAYHHPYIACLGIFIGMPVFILISVFGGTMLVMLPFSLLFGWV